MDKFLPHAICLAADPPLLWLTVIAHAGTAFAYFGIPLMLAISIRQVSVIPIWLRVLFAVFILLCGISHILEIITLWIPVYWWLAAEVTATAVVSLSTLYLLPLGIIQIVGRQKRARP